MYTIKYNFKDRDCYSFDDLKNKIEEIPNGVSFSIIDKRTSMHGVLYLDKRENKLYESYRQKGLFTLGCLNKKL